MTPKPKRNIDKETRLQIRMFKKKSPAKIKDEEKNQRVKDITDLKHIHKPKGKWTFGGWWSKRQSEKKPEQAYIVTMFYNNGTSKTFIITTDKKTFIHKSKMYVIIYEEVWKDLNLDNYHFFYNEGCSVPINRELYWEKDMDADITKQEAFFSVTPHNLSPIIKMEYVKALANSVELNKYLQLNTLLNFLNLAGTFIVIAMLYYGVFK